jgi:hypothetical protein
MIILNNQYFLLVEGLILEPQTIQIHQSHPFIVLWSRFMFFFRIELCSQDINFRWNRGSLNSVGQAIYSCCLAIYEQLHRSATHTHPLIWQAPHLPPGKSNWASSLPPYLSTMERRHLELTHCKQSFLWADHQKDTLFHSNLTMNEGKKTCLLAIDEMMQPSRALCNAKSLNHAVLHSAYAKLEEMECRLHQKLVNYTYNLCRNCRICICVNSPSANLPWGVVQTMFLGRSSCLISKSGHQVLDLQYSFRLLLLQNGRRWFIYSRSASAGAGEPDRHGTPRRHRPPLLSQPPSLQLLWRIWRRRSRSARGRGGGRVPRPRAAGRAVRGVGRAAPAGLHSGVPGRGDLLGAWPGPRAPSPPSPSSAVRSPDSPTTNSLPSDPATLRAWPSAAEEEVEAAARGDGDGDGDGAGEAEGEATRGEAEGEAMGGGGGGGDGTRGEGEGEGKTRGRRGRRRLGFGDSWR